MANLRLRLTGDETAVRQLVNQLNAIEGVDDVQHRANLMPQMDDPDSSSAGLVSDQGPASQVIDVEFSSSDCLHSIQNVARRFAERHGAVLEAEPESVRGIDDSAATRH